jgi:hypothetical protein
MIPLKPFYFVIKPDSRVPMNVKKESKTHEYLVTK